LYRLNGYGRNYKKVKDKLITDLMRFIRKTPLLLFFLVAGFASCKKAGVVAPAANNVNKGKNLVLTALDQQKVTADNAFSLKLFKNLNGRSTSDTNLFVSPLSVSFALGMTSNGANGTTLDAFKSTLNTSPG